MEVLEKIPKENVTFDDIRDTLNNNGGSVSNEMSSFFSTAAKINASARYKPVRLAGDFTDGNPNWYKAYNGLCGYNLDLAIANTWNDLITCYGRENNGWVYELPTGGNFPMRIDDFRGYHPKARPLTYGFDAPNTVYKSQNSATIALALPLDDGYSLTWNDFDTFEPNLKDFYFGVYIKGTNYVVRATASDTIANGGSQVTFNPSIMREGSYKVYPFICSVPYAVGEGDKAMTVYSLPNVTPSNMLVRESTVQIYALASKVNRTETINYEITVVNYSSSTVILSNNSLRIYQMGQLQEVVGDYKAVIPDTSVAAGERKVIFEGTGSVGYIDFDFATLPLSIFVSLGKGQYTATAPVANDLSSGGGLT